MESHTHAFVMIYVKFHRSVCFVIKCATKIFLFTPPDHCCLPLKKVLDIRSKLMSTSTFMDSLFMVELNSTQSATSLMLQLMLHIIAF